MQRLRKQWLAILYVFIFLLTDPQLERAYALENTGRQTQPSAAAECSLDPFLGTKGSEIHLVYELNGGINSNYNPTVIGQEELPFVLNLPVRDGYNFAGWYTDSSCTQKITQIDESNAANMVLFAKWTKLIDNHYNVEMYAYHAAVVGRSCKGLKECSYDFLDDIEIPGMPSTREKDYLENMIGCEGQCLQGLCFTPEYVMVTSYSERASTPGSLMIFDRSDGTYLVTLGMKKESHLGGIAFDGDNIWICHSNSNTLERIPYEFIQKIAEDAPKCFVDATALLNEYRLKNVPSCITCYGDRIWVATHTKLFDSEMLSYSYCEEEDTLAAVETYHIPSKVQGIAFDQEGAVYLSTSYGRNNSSYLKVYSSLLTLNRRPNHPDVKVEMPPCSEEIVIADGNVYILFESASRKYFEGTDGKGSSTAPIDKVLEVNMASIW